MKVSEFAGRGRTGTVHGSLDAVPGADGYVLSLDLSGEGFTLVPPGEAAEVAAARPAVDFEARLSGRGTSLRQLAGSLDGHVLAEVGEGRLPGGTNRLARFFFGDLSRQILQTVNPLASKNPIVELRCAVVLFDIDDGVVSGAPAVVVQTRELNIFGFGQVDLSTESLSVDFNTRARRGIGISVSDLVNPATRVGGTMAAPTIELDPGTALVQGGAAVATGGLSFLAMKFRDRFLSAEDPCAKAIEDYEARRREQRAGE